MSLDAPTSFNPQDPAAVLEQEITALAGVRAARVVSTPTGRISEIHVVAEQGKSAKQVVRDIQTLARARFDMNIDYRVVSVVQLGQGQFRARSAPARPVLSAVSWRVEGNAATCTIDLSVREDRFSGEASGASTSHNRLRLAARAAAEALRAMDADAKSFDTADVIITEAGGHRVALAVLTLPSGQMEEILVGAAVVRIDEPDAVARAVLDAVNRRISLAID